MTDARRLYACLILVTLLLAGLVGTCHAQDSTQHQEQFQVVTYRELSEDAGLTICYKGRAYSFIATNLTPAFDSVVKVHEAKHREQVKRFPSCGPFYGWYRSTTGRLDSEAEAFAAGWCLARDYGTDPMLYRKWVIESLGAASASLPQISAAIKKYEGCP